MVLQLILVLGLVCAGVAVEGDSSQNARSGGHEAYYDTSEVDQTFLRSNSNVKNCDDCLRTTFRIVEKAAEALEIGKNYWANDPCAELPSKDKAICPDVIEDLRKLDSINIFESRRICAKTHYCFTKASKKKTTPRPTVKPTSKPIVKPTSKPIVKPIHKPTVKPTSKPIVKPTSKPIVKPIHKPTVKPTSKPIVKPTSKPIVKPTSKPIVKPTSKPIVKPTSKPIVKPTSKPIVKPIDKPNVNSTSKPIVQPTSKPTVKPAARRRRYDHKARTHGVEVPYEDNFENQASKENEMVPIHPHICRDCDDIVREIKILRTEKMLYPHIITTVCEKYEGQKRSKCYRLAYTKEHEIIELLNAYNMTDHEICIALKECQAHRDYQFCKPCQNFVFYRERMGDNGYHWERIVCSPALTKKKHQCINALKTKKQQMLESLESGYGIYDTCASVDLCAPAARR